MKSYFLNVAYVKSTIAVGTYSRQVSIYLHFYILFSAPFLPIHFESSLFTLIELPLEFKKELVLHSNTSGNIILLLGIKDGSTPYNHFAIKSLISANRMP